MNRRPLYFISREKEWELIQKLLTIVPDADPTNTAVIMASPDYSATVAMHLAHAWSKNGEMVSIIPVDVTYPDELPEPYIDKMLMQSPDIRPFSKLVLVEAGIIRGGNWRWMLDVLINQWGFQREDLTLVALCENIHSAIKSDYVAEYYDDDKEELMFYFERYNKHWPIKPVVQEDDTKYLPRTTPIKNNHPWQSER
jgi:hypothetical protein